MYSRCRISRFAILLAIVLAPQVAQAAALRICAEPDNLPMSQEKTKSGFEIEAAQLLAKDMGRTLEVKWIAQRDPSYFRQTIGAGVCDAIMSVPAGFNRLTVTRPWYRTSFYFVGRDDAALPKGFDDAVLQNAKIGVPAIGQGETPPAIALTSRGLGDNLRPYSVYEPQKMVAAVADRTLDLAVVWGPFAGWFASQNRPPLIIAPTPARDAVTPLAFAIAIGVKKGNDELKGKLETALDHQQGALAAILDKWHVPHIQSPGEEL